MINKGSVVVLGKRGLSLTTITRVEKERESLTTTLEACRYSTVISESSPRSLGGNFAGFRLVPRFEPHARPP